MSSLPAGLLAVLRCAGCRAAGLVDRDAELACGACGRTYPVQAGVPVMVADAVAARGDLLDPALAAAVMQRLGIPPGAVEQVRVRHASGARVRLPPGSDVAWQDGLVLAGLPGAPVATAPEVTEGRLACAWPGDLIPRAMPPATGMLASIRFCNASRCVMPADGDGRVTVAACWNGAAEEVRTKLPVDLAPGQTITMTLRLMTPAQPGRHTLRLAAVQEGVRWLEPAFGPVAVQVAADAGFTPPPHWVLDGEGPHDAEADRARAETLLRQWVAQRGVARPRVLALGAEAGAAVARAGMDAVVADGDLLALQLGRLVPGPTLPCLCAGAAPLPLAEAAFDAVLGFGLLRHAADPAALLRGLRPQLRPGGFIGLACEPVGQAWSGAAPPALLAAWRRGLDMQSYGLQEYALIFGRAGLRAAELIVDGASLKARLVAEPAFC